MADQPPSAAVLERCAISPPPHAAELTLPLLHFDITWLYFHPVHRLLFFEFPCSKSHFIQSILPQFKHSLSQTLAHFPPLAGKIIHPADGAPPFSRFSPGDSVVLTVAESDLDLADLTADHPRRADDFHAFVPRLPPPEKFSGELSGNLAGAGAGGDAIAVLALQVTLFPGRGVCLGITNHHAIGDASSVVGFVKAWAAVNGHGVGGDDARQLLEEKRLLPSFDRSAVADPGGLDAHYWSLMRRSRAVESPPVSFPLNKHRATFVLAAGDVLRLKRHVEARRPAVRPSSFAAACALFWSCLARAESPAADGGAAAGDGDGEAEYFCFAADCRGRMSPAPAPGYFGNCLAFVKAESTTGRLRGEDGVAEAAERISAAVRGTVDNEKGILDGAEGWPAEFGRLMGKRLFGVAGSPRFDLYGVNFGWGPSRKYESPSIDSDTSMSLCKSRDSEGGLEIGLSRPIQILNAFQAVLDETLKNL